MSRMTVVGNLTRDPELSFTNKGTALCKATVADSYRANKDADEEVSFIDVTLWGTLAENFADLKKGNRVFVEGRIRQENWETDDGQKRSKLKLVAESAGPDLRFTKVTLTNVGKRTVSDPDDSPF